MPTQTKIPTIQIATRLYKAGFREYADLIAATRNQLISVYHLQSAQATVQARIAAAYVIAIQSRDEGIPWWQRPGQGVTELPFVPAPEGYVKNPITGTIEAAPGTVKKVMDVGEFLTMLSNWHTWLRITEVVGGGVLAVIAIRMLARETGVL